MGVICCKTTTTRRNSIRALPLSDDDKYLKSRQNLQLEWDKLSAGSEKFDFEPKWQSSTSKEEIVNVYEF